MNIEAMVIQVLENVVNDLMFVDNELDRETAERIACVVIRNPQLAVELESKVRDKRALGV